MTFNKSNLWDYDNKFKWMEFRQARDFVRELGLSNMAEWVSYAKGERKDLPMKPDNIPSFPEMAYKHFGWISWEEWFGVERVLRDSHSFGLWEAKQCSKWLPFQKAREYSRSLGLEYKEEWEAYIVRSESEAIPKDIPVNPDHIYRFTGWRSWKDWLLHSDDERDYLSLKRVKEFIWCLQLKSREEWFDFVKEKEQYEKAYFIEIPRRPNLEYAKCGWKDWDDWLGTKHSFIPYKDTVKFIRKLNLESRADWSDYCRGNHFRHKKSTDKIPCYPDLAYANSGWISWEEWLAPSNIKKQGDKIIFSDSTRECNCKGLIKDCLKCDGKGYTEIQ